MIGFVKQVVELLGLIPVGSAKAEVHHVHAVLDGPSEARQKAGGFAGQLRAEYLDAVDVGLGCCFVDDARAGGAVAERIHAGIRLHASVVTVRFDDNPTLDATVLEHRMGGVYAAIDNSNPAPHKPDPSDSIIPVGDIGLPICRKEITAPIITLLDNYPHTVSL